jgi:integrase
VRKKQPQFVVHKAKKPHGACRWYIIGRPDGKRIRAWFPTKEAADAEATERNVKMRKLGNVAVTLDHELIAIAKDGTALLQPHGKTLRDAVTFYLTHLQTVSKAVLGKDLCAAVRREFSRRLDAKEISPRHEQTMQETLRKFESEYAAANVTFLTGRQVKEWLSKTGLAVRTRNRHLDYIHNAFNTGKNLGVLPSNPLVDVEFFTDLSKRSRTISIFPPETIQKFLDGVRVAFVPFYSICCFTGLRRSEVEKLDWSEIKLERRLIDLPPEKSKNHRRKLIEVTDNLYAWLKPYEKKSAPVLPESPGLQIVMDEAAEKANITSWQQNVLRHCFCSYAVALKRLSWTATQADHSERQLKTDYWEMVTKEQADRYWSIKPSQP